MGFASIPFAGFLLFFGDPTPYKKNSYPLKRHRPSSTNQGRDPLQDDSNCHNTY
jgi:hypothetical protein